MPAWLSLQRLIEADPSAPAHNHYFDIVSLNLYTNPENLYTVPNLVRQLLGEWGIQKPAASASGR